MHMTNGLKIFLQ